MEPLTAELVRIAERMKRRPEQRARFARALREALEVVEPRTPCADVGCPVMTPGLAQALRTMADGLSLAADNAAHVADHAAVKTRPPKRPHHPAHS